MKKMHLNLKIDSFGIYADVPRLLSRFHYSQGDLRTIKEITQRLIDIVKNECEFEINIYDTYVDAAMTLGKEVDELIAQFSMQGKLTEQLMAENIASEILMRQYKKLEEIIENETGMAVLGYHFWGDDEAYPIEGIGEILKDLSLIGITYTADYSLRPAKSVVYRAQLGPKGKEAPGECGTGKNPCDTCKHPCEFKHSERGL